MPRSGIKIISDTPGSGPELKTGDRVRLIYDIQLNRGDFLAKDQEAVWTVGDRNIIAGLRYGLEGMRGGGARRFRANPHLCYRDAEVASVPKNAVLICDIRHVEILAESLRGTKSCAQTRFGAASWAAGKPHSGREMRRGQIRTHGNS